MNFNLIGPYGPQITTTEEFNRRVQAGAFDVISDVDLLKADVMEFLASRERALDIKADEYYKGYHDILGYKRLVDKEVIDLLPNHPTVDNQYSVNTDKKVNYSFSKPFSLQLPEGYEAYKEQLELLFNNKNRNKIKAAARTAVSGGKAYAIPYLKDGFMFKTAPVESIRRIYSDGELIAFYRVYDELIYEGKKEKVVTKIEYYDSSGINFYVIEDGEMKIDKEPEPYITIDGQPLNWSKPPLIVFQANDIEQGLIHRIKTLQDGINLITTLFINNAEEDIRSSVFVLKGYDGEDLSGVRKKILKYGAVKVNPTEGGGIDTLEIKVNPENYKLVLNILKNALLENARSYDAKSEKMGDANMMNIQSMYSDIDLDANDLESEFSESLEDLIWFYNQYLALKGFKVPEVPVNFAFNRDVMMNEEAAIRMCVDSKGVISDRTIIENHPWVKDADEEYEELQKQEDHRYGQDVEVTSYEE